MRLWEGQLALAEPVHQPRIQNNAFDQLRLDQVLPPAGQLAQLSAAACRLPLKSETPDLCQCRDSLHLCRFLLDGQM